MSARLLTPRPRGILPSGQSAPPAERPTPNAPTPRTDPKSKSRSPVSPTPGSSDGALRGEEGLILHEERVNQGRDYGAEERAGDVDQRSAKVLLHYRGAEPAGGVHRAAGERAAPQDVERDDEADEQAADLVRPRVDGGAEDHEYQEERGDPLDQEHDRGDAEA